MAHIPELFAAVATWAFSLIEDSETPENVPLWIGVTKPNEHFDAAVTVKINRTTETIDEIPSFSALLTNDQYFPGVMGVVGLTGGMLIAAGPGDEDRLIRHFKTQHEVCANV